MTAPTPSLRPNSIAGPDNIRTITSEKCDNLQRNRFTHMQTSARREADAAVSDSKSAVINMTDVRFGYTQDQPVIASFSAELRAGRLCAMIGPNAAGKTTLIKLLLGQLQPWSGSCTLNGDETSQLDAARRAAHISYVPQRSELSFAFSVQQVVAMGRYALSESPQAIEWSLQTCDLFDVRERVYAQLSVGQQQRVLLARALAQSYEPTSAPHVGNQAMLLDEPASSMDLRHVHQTMRILADLAKNGLAVLVVLHDLNLAAHYADEIWLVNQGVLVAQGDWRQVMKPSVLEPIYRVPLQVLSDNGDNRPVFVVRDETNLLN